MLLTSATRVAGVPLTHIWNMSNKISCIWNLSKTFGQGPLRYTSQEWWVALTDWTSSHEFPRQCIHPIVLLVSELLICVIMCALVTDYRQTNFSIFKHFLNISKTFLTSKAIYIWSFKVVVALRAKNIQNKSTILLHPYYALLHLPPHPHNASAEQMQQVLKIFSINSLIYPLPPEQGGV